MEASQGYPRFFAEITAAPISPERVIEAVKSDRSGCVATYVGLIRDRSEGKAVLAVEYGDSDGKARERLEAMAREAAERFPVNAIALVHRIGTLKVGEINLVVAVAAAHRTEGFAACQFLIDRFKESLPTQKKETYQSGEGAAGAGRGRKGGGS